MRFIKGWIAAALIVALNGTSLMACMPMAARRKPVVQLAILLDTSSSMDGLIDQARSQLWRVVNELGNARKGGVMPELQVALYEYGNDGLPAERGHIRRCCRSRRISTKSPRNCSRCAPTAGRSTAGR